jgi:hypothetical protein
MGLAVCVGVLATGSDADPDWVEQLRRDFAHVNRVLAANGLPAHAEPECLPDLPYREQLLSFPYRWFQYFRRAVAYARLAPDRFRPVGEGEEPSEDHLIADEITYLESHLICHSASEGYYVPIDFPDPLFGDRAGGLPGDILGSSQQALRELVQTAPLLEIPLAAGALSDQSALAIAKESDESHPYWIERKVWLALFEAFRHSVEHKCAVVFG